MVALGYPTPKEEQVQVVEQFLLGRDVFVSLPTGGGKSLCYGCLPIVFDTLRQVKQQSIVLVISPLNALMEDQVGRFSERGLKAAQLSTKDDTSVQLYWTARHNSSTVVRRTS
jgi:ATP-dependent DNA helicase RecQ